MFDQLRPLILSEGSGDSHRRAADILGLSESSVKVATHRLRRRFREAVRAEIAQTVSTPAEVEEELRCLMVAMSE